MKITDHLGYEIHLPTSGGKAGTGYNVTTNIQVRHESAIVKQFKFRTANADARKQALHKARQWIERKILDWENYPGTPIQAPLSCAGDYVISHWPTGFILTYRPPGKHVPMGKFDTLDKAKFKAMVHKINS